MPSGARHSLSSLLVVHPVAALLNLICLALGGAAHLHAPSHSARYLLGLLILFLPTLLVSLLAFLVDILLFVPHLQWGGWIVLASTVIIAICGIVTCAMRRTLVSRKARKRRIAENAEMSGENFYNRQGLPKLNTSSPISPDSKQPIMVNGAPGADNLPSFATYDANRRMSDERPLNSRSPPIRGPGSVPPESRDGSERYGPMNRSPKDEFGNPIPPNGFGPPSLRRDPSDPRMRDQYMNSRPGPPGPPGPPMGPPMGPPRGGFRGRGYGPPRGRGGFGPGPGPGPGSRGPPPQGYPPRGGIRGGRGGPPMRGAPMVRGDPMMGRGGPPPGYPPQPQETPPNQYDIIDDYSRQTQDFSGQNPYQSPYGSRNQSPAGRMRAPSPAPPMPGAPVGQAVEMDAQTGRSSETLPSGFGPPGNRVRASDDDVQGMVGLQQQRQDSSERIRSPTSMYSQQE